MIKRVEVTAADVVKPTFLFLGPGKSGSSWIFEILREHPEVFVPAAKDLQFFDRYYERGLDWYYSFFTGGAGFKAVGEMSHNYFWQPIFAERILEALPDVKLFCCLREPVERTLSSYFFTRSLGVGEETSFEEYIDMPHIVQGNRYYENLKPFFELFDADRLLVTLYDDLCADPGVYASNLFDFLGVDPSFEPPSLHRKVNTIRQARVDWMANIAYRIGLGLRGLGLANVVGAVKRSSAFQKLFFEPKRRSVAVSADTKRELRERYLPTYPPLEQLIGRTLPPAWYRSEDE